MEYWIIALIIVACILFLSLFFSFVPVTLWISAIAANVRVSIITLVGMRLRRVVPSRIINPLIKAEKAGLSLNINKLEAHYLAGGNVDRVVNSLIAAQRANISLEFERAAAIDLAGRDVLEAVQMSVNPKVIETPIVAAIAKDGIELKAKAKITVRANIDRLVGGAGEQTVVARVGEGIVTTIGSAESHKEVLENPDKISRTVLSKGLNRYRLRDPVDRHSRRGCRKETSEPSCRPTRPRPIRGSLRPRRKKERAMAVAREQEMVAEVQEMRAKVVAAEAEIDRNCDCAP